MSDEQTPRRTGHLTPAEKETLAKQIAAGAVVGESVLSMSKRLLISRVTVNKILNDPATQDLIRKIGDDAVNNARSQFRAAADKLGPLALRRLEEIINGPTAREALEGIKTVCRIINLDGKEDAAGGGTLIVQLPGAAPEKAIEVESYPVDDGGSGAV